MGPRHRERKVQLVSGFLTGIVMGWLQVLGGGASGREVLQAVEQDELE